MSEWIDVGTRCPEPTENDVLIAYSGYSIGMGWQGISGQWYRRDGKHYYDIVSGVTHWQPLPAHPNWIDKQKGD